MKDFKIDKNTYKRLKVSYELELPLGTKTVDSAIQSMAYLKSKEDPRLIKKVNILATNIKWRKFRV